MHYRERVRIRGVLGLVAGVSLVLMIVLLYHRPNIEYRHDAFEIECRSIAAGGGPRVFLDATSGPRYSVVVKGENVVDDLIEEARERGVADAYFVQRQLDVDCIDRRARVLMWVQIAGIIFVLSLAGALWSGRRR